VWPAWGRRTATFNSWMLASALYEREGRTLMSRIASARSIGVTRLTFRR